MLGGVSLVVAALVGLSFRQWESYRRANAEVDRTRETLTAVDSVLADVTDAETGQRGFLLTDDSHYLAPYTRALAELPNHLATLQGLLSGSPQGTRDFNELNAVAQQKMDELRQTLEVRRMQGTQAARAIVLTDRGERAMDSIRALCARIRGNGIASQVRASADAQTAAGIALLITVAGSIVLLFFFAFGFQPFASPDPQAWHRSSLLRYGAAILAVVVISLIRAALTPLIGSTNFPFTLYFCAVMFAAWFGGFRPALLSMVLSLVAGAWFFAAPTHTLLVRGHDDQIAMLLVVLVGFGTGLLSRSQRSAVERAGRAESAEREERRRFETTLASIGDAVIATDVDGRVTLMNSVAEKLTGFALEEALGKPLTEVFRIVNEETRQSVENPVDKVRRMNHVVGLANHTVLIGKDGQEIAIDDSGAPILTPDGSLAGVVLVFRDVTEARGAEVLLMEQAALLEEAWDAIIVWNEPGPIRYWSRGAEEMYGWSRREAAGKPVHDLLRTKFPVPLSEIVERVHKERRWQGELVHTRKDGTRVTVLSRWAALPGNDASGAGPMLEINTDITARKLAQQKLEEQAVALEVSTAEARSQRQRLGLALTAGKMGVFEVAPVGKSVWWSPETYALFGVNAGEFRPARNAFAALIHPADRESFMQYWDENIAEFQPINHEFRILMPGGKVRWISCRGFPTYDNAGSAIHYSGLFLDITERREAEQALRKFEKLSAAARLSAAMAHEINNPLGAVGNLIYLAKHTAGLPKSAADQLALAEQELERVAHVVRQTLGFYRESSRAEAVDIPELIDSVLKIFSLRVTEKKIRLARNFGECAPVYAVRGEIRQVVSNLLVNAIEAVNEGGGISVVVQMAGAGKGRAVEITVSDDGHGIVPENIEHIFEPFFTTKAGTGTGLGLWVAKEIVERHHGSIAVEAAEDQSEGRGTTFTVRLPAERQGAAVSP
jgi:PAS domain S-box-containing protein